jgi:acetylornithine deacetylase/succinyl-diaminopimelate desuccinylase-like protein
MDSATARARVSAMMPDLVDELGLLVGFASVAFPGFPAEPVHRMGEATADLLRRSGADNARLLDIPGGYPAVYADIPGPAGAPVVLLYGHYDVQPASPEQDWQSDPWTASRKDDGRVYGRGAADDKSGIVIHAGTLRAFGDRPPVGIKILIEGEEETVSHLEGFVDANPGLFDCDLFVIADMGNVTVGEPALTTALRGDVSATVRVRTLRAAVHSGLFGGPAPDALTALIHILATLHDDAGNVAVADLHSFTWPGGDFPADDFLASCGLLPGIDLIGTGSLASRLWSMPSVSVIGIDAPSVAEAANVLIPEATAKVSMRIAPGADADRELALLMDHLRAAAPWHVTVDVTRVKVGHPFQVDTSGAGVEAARQGLTDAFGKPAGTIGSGGSIPLVASLKRAAPRADVILWGAEDLAHARIHAPNESVDPAEIERMVLAQVLTLQNLAGSPAPRPR